ncbi:alpha/beta hydrolase [Paenibacillus sp. BIHB 4019]|uniref:Alpha/beta hydrolase n=1 Tax=Paenibacillus sp. BIHB 4019 TaxID=1870819 RepID=A0A1B2DTE9_9BACL|nr:alpha/beta hydrolase [Paenibacillus sp. BIHB 4019]
MATQFLDVSYANQSENQKLNIYLPNEGEGPFPVIIAIHGGGFMMGNRTGGDLASMLEGVNHGYAVVTVEYRMSGEETFPAAINDVKAAIRFIRANADKYQLNADKIAAWGDSAGGNLASLAGTTSGTNELYDDSLGYPDVSDKLTAVVDWFGPINFLKFDEQFDESGITPMMGQTSSANSAESKYIGQLITEAPDLVAAANPETYITADDPPFFIEHGTADANVPTQQSVDFASKLESVLGQDKVTLTLLDGAQHGGSQFDEEQNVELVFEFLDKYMK